MKLPLFLVALFIVLIARAVIAAEVPVKALMQSYFDSFGCESTGLLYHQRLDGPKGSAVLSAPEEIARGEVRGKPMPYGYGSGIQDIALENGQVLFALCEAHEATGDELYADKARMLFRSLQALARLSPEPGFVPRGPHPDGKSYYRNSSRDQHAAYIEALWRYGRSPLATDEDKRFIADTLGKIAKRLERYDWRIMVEDGSAQAHVGFTWKQFTTIGAVSLLGALAMVADATGDPHWRGEYERFSAEKDGERWSKWLHPDSLAEGQPFTLYSNQFSQSLTALRRCETDGARQKQIAEFQRRWALRALESNVFDTNHWRRLDWAGERDEAATQAQLTALGLDLKKPMTVLNLFDAYDRKLWEQPGSAAFGTMHKLCFGLTTVAVHGALLSGDKELVRRVKPTVERMVGEFMQHQAAYAGGENFNRTVILGLLAEAPPTSAAGADYGRELPIATAAGLGPVIDVTVRGQRAYAIGQGRLHILDTSDPGKPRVLGSLGGLGSVRQVVAGDGTVFVSSRQDGLFIVDVGDSAAPKLLCRYDTIEWATGLALSGDVLFVACRHFGVELVDVSRPEKPAHLATVRTGEAQSVVARDGWLYTGVWGASEVVVADVRNARAPVIVGRVPLDGYGDGVDVRGKYLYAATGHHSRQPHADENAPGYGHVSGLHWYDLYGGPKPVALGQKQAGRFNPQGGVAVRDGRVIATRSGGFVAFAHDDPRPLGAMAVRRIASKRIAGKPTIRDELLFVADRSAGTVDIFDLTDESNPKLLDSFITPGNPGRVVAIPEGYLIPDGYGGLLLRKTESAP